MRTVNLTLKVWARCGENENGFVHDQVERRVQEFQCCRINPVQIFEYGEQRLVSGLPGSSG